MTVKELIDQLSTCDQDRVVVIMSIDDQNYNCCSPLSCIWDCNYHGDDNLGVVTQGQLRAIDIKRGITEKYKLGLVLEPRG